MGTIHTSRQTVPFEEVSPLICETLAAGGDVSFFPHGKSMRPFLRSGQDRVILRRPETYRVNDMVLFRRDDGAFVLHRLLAIRGSQYTLCGDAQTKGETLRADQLLGVVVGFYRNGRYIDCHTSRRYRFFSTLWRFSRPVRYALSFVLHPIRKGGRLIKWGLSEFYGLSDAKSG